MFDLQTIKALNSPENANVDPKIVPHEGNTPDQNRGKPKTKYSMMLRTLKWVRNLLDAQMKGSPTGRFSIEDYVKVDNAIKLAQKQPHGTRVVFNKDRAIYEEVK